MHNNINLERALDPSTLAAVVTAVVCFNDEITIVSGNPDTATRIIAVDVSGSVNTIVPQIREALGSFLMDEDNEDNDDALTLPHPKGMTAIVKVMQTYAKPGVELVIITDGEENCYEGELNGKPFRSAECMRWMDPRPRDDGDGDAPR